MDPFVKGLMESVEKVLSEHPGHPLQDILQAVEEFVVLWALDEHKGNKTHAAREMNILRTTLVEKCRKSYQDRIKRRTSFERVYKKNR
jgi:hypothetical protein